MHEEEMNNFIAAAKAAGTGSATKLFKAAQPQDFTTGEHGKISGYFATFDRDHGDSSGDIISSHAFDKTLAERKKTGHPFPLCLNHDLNIIIGRVTDIGTDRKGAYFTAEFFPTEKAQEARAIALSGVLWQFSFAYNVIKQRKTRAGDGSTVNELLEVELFEVSIVPVPANPRATVTEVKANPKAAALLDEIRRIKAEDDKRVSDLLRAIHANAKEAAALDLKELQDMRKHLKGMEAKALQDIGQADLNNDQEWKEGRKSALEAIRRELNRVDLILEGRKHPNRTKTGSRPITEPKARIK